MSCEACMWGCYANCPCCSEEPEEPNCGGEGARGGCEGCEACVVEVRAGRWVTARAPRTDAGRDRRARNGIQPGERVWLVEGFTYQVRGGPRFGYFRYERAIR
jgi:hypothetical protein